MCLGFWGLIGKLYSIVVSLDFMVDLNNGFSFMVFIDVHTEV